MSNILDFTPKEQTPEFSLHAYLTGEGVWAVSVTQFYDSKMPVHEMFREISDALIGISGGMIHNAEELEPTKRGCMVSNLAFFEDGYISLKTAPLDSPERKAWFLQALDKIKSGIMAGDLDK